MAMVLERVFTSTALGLKADSSWLGSKRQLSMHLCEAEMRCRRVAALEAQCDSPYKAPSHPIPGAFDRLPLCPTALTFTNDVPPVLSHGRLFTGCPSLTEALSPAKSRISHNNTRLKPFTQRSERQ